MTTLPPCPHCDSSTGVFRRAYATGTVEFYYTDAGEFLETNVDKTRFIPYSEAIRCDRCLKIRRDLILAGMGVVPALDTVIDCHEEE